MCKGMGRLQVERNRCIHCEQSRLERGGEISGSMIAFVCIFGLWKGRRVGRVVMCWRIDQSMHVPLVPMKEEISKMLFENDRFDIGWFLLTQTQPHLLSRSDSIFVNAALNRPGRHEHRSAPPPRRHRTNSQTACAA